MASFAISFRVGYEGNHSERYSSMIAKIKELASGSTWDETTSFILLESGLGADSLASAIYVGSKMDSAKDSLLVVEIGAKNYATRGKIDYPNTLASFFK